MKMRAASWLALLLMIAMPVAQGQERTGVVSAALFASVVPDAGDNEVSVLDVRYAPGGMNPRHFHPAAVTFHVLSGTPVFQEEGKPPITLKPGESLMIPAGTTHARWSRGGRGGLRWLDFIVGKRGKGRPTRKP